MKRYLYVLTAMLWATVATSFAQSDGNTPSLGGGQGEVLFVFLKSGGFDAFPQSMLVARENSGGELRLKTIDGSEFTYAESDVEKITDSRPDTPLPVLTSFKYNNKYNDQLHIDAEAVIQGDSLLTVTVGAIGRWLTPSFQLSDDEAGLYLGTELLESKVSRHPVADDVVYTVARPNERVLVCDGEPPVWGDPVGPYTFEPLTLTSDMLSTNAPSNYDEGLDKMIDGNPDTYFHSTWGEGQYEKLPLEECPYIDVALAGAVSNIRFSYQTRSDVDRFPTSFELLVSNDGEQWESRRVLTADDGMPLDLGAVFTSPVIDLQGSYTYLRFKMLAANYKNYLCLAELQIEKVTPNDNPDEPQLIDPGKMICVMMPYGRSYRLNIDWLADRQQQVPRIDINTADRQMISSKEVYKDATITIDGAGVFDSMPETPVKIKGRGNSSWSRNPRDKNPYRLKFDNKQKPLGLTKGKNWVLLANKIGNSMMTNAVGMKIARLVGTAAANHITPVELYINGDYRGNYNLTEKVGFSNNSVDLDDESAAALLELDTYYDETYKFRTNFYGLPVNIKEPDFSEGETTLTLTTIRNDFNAITRDIYQHHDITDRVDATMLGRFLMVNELIDNYEIQHPKSTYLYRADLNDPDSKWIFGPVWDLDWAYGYEHNSNYCTTDARIDFWNATQMEAIRFIQDLRNETGKEVDKAVYRAWHDFMEGGGLQETLDFIDDYYAYARPSFEHNAEQWGDGVDYARVAGRMKNWIQERAHYVYERLTPYDLTEPDETDGIKSLAAEGRTETFDRVSVYSPGGHLLARSVDISSLKNILPKGIYVVVNNNGKSRKFINK